MGYYTIDLAESSKDITTIVTEFGKFRYNKLPMGMCISGDIFQAKVNELLGDIDGVKAYIDDILVLNKGTFTDHIEQLRICFRRIQVAGLKVNAKKCSFGLSEIPYLGYIITRQGIKPDPKKIQGILDLERPSPRPSTVPYLASYKTTEICGSVAPIFFRLSQKPVQARRDGK